MLFAVLALVLAPVPLVVTAAPAHACSCVDSTPEEIWERSTHVVVGSIIDRDGEPEGPDDLTYTVQVTAVYKGSVPEVTTFVSSAYGDACGWLAEVGDTVDVLVLHENDGELLTNMCVMEQATPIPAEYVGDEYPPEGGGADPSGDDGSAPPGGSDGETPPASGPPWLAIALGSAVLVLGIGWLGLRRPLR